VPNALPAPEYGGQGRAFPVRNGSLRRSAPGRDAVGDSEYVTRVTARGSVPWVAANVLPASGPRDSAGGVRLEV
jgi:hypothetical protein